MYRDPEEYLPFYGIYLQRLPMNVLKCRVDGHDFPDEEKELKKGKNSRVKIRRTRRGSYIKETPCNRKCGTSVFRFIDSSGYIEKAAKVQHDEYEYPEYGYLLPEKARSGHGLTRQMRAMARLELLNRLNEWITEE